MSVFWQEIVTVAIVFTAGVYLARKWFWQKGKATTSCSTCSSCAAESPAQGTLVPVEALQLSTNSSGEESAVNEN